MTDKIAVDRDFLEHAVVALEYAYSADDEMVMESIRFLRHALAAQPAEQCPVKSYWLIECKYGFTGWYTGQRLDCRFFDTDPRKAYKFASKELAENEISERGNSCMTATEHVDIAPQPAEAQQKPVAWRHSKTGQLYDLEEEVPLVDGDEWAEPLYAAPVAQQEPSAWRQWSTKLHDWDYQTNRGDLRPDTHADPLFVAAAPPEAIEQDLQKIADFGQDQEPVRRLSDYDIWKNDVIMAANADIGLPMADLMKLVLAIEAAMVAKQTGESDGM